MTWSLSVMNVNLFSADKLTIYIRSMRFHGSAYSNSIVETDSKESAWTQYVFRELRVFARLLAPPSGIDRIFPFEESFINLYICLRNHSFLAVLQMQEQISKRRII